MYTLWKLLNLANSTITTIFSFHQNIKSNITIKQPKQREYVQNHSNNQFKYFFSKIKTKYMYALRSNNLTMEFHNRATNSKLTSTFKISLDRVYQNYFTTFFFHFSFITYVRVKTKIQCSTLVKYELFVLL